MKRFGFGILAFGAATAMALVGLPGAAQEQPTDHPTPLGLTVADRSLTTPFLWVSLWLIAR